MAFIDILLLAVVALGAIQGFRKGIITGFASIAGIILGIVACRLFGDAVNTAIASAYPETTEYPGAPYTGTVLAYLLLFAAVYLACFFCARLLKGIVHAVCLGGIDRLAGVVFGMFKYLLALSLVLNALFAIAPNSALFHSSGLLDGKCLEWTMRLAPWLWGLDIFPDTGT